MPSTLVNLNPKSNLPFMNIFKQSASLGLATTSNSGSPATDYFMPQKVNADGYPITTLTTAGLSAQFIIPYSWNGKRCVIAWSGQGGINTGLTVANVDPTTASGIASSNAYYTNFAGNNVRVVFDLSLAAGNGTDLNFVQFTLPTGVTFNNMSGAYLCRLSDEADVLAGKLTMPEFRAARLTLGADFLRTMDWTGNIVSQATKFSDQWPLTAFCWGNANYRPDLFVGNITGTNNYVSSVPSGFPSTPTDGATLTGVIVNASTSTSNTLQAGSWPAIGIVNTFGDPSSTLLVGPATFVYDSILAKWRVAPTSPQGQGLFPGDGVPLKAQVQVANECSANLYYNFPPDMKDAEVALATQYVRDNLNSGLKWCVEVGNELWNDLFQWRKTYEYRSIALGFPDQYSSYRGFRFRQVMGVVTTNWAPRSMSTLVRNLATFVNDYAPNGPTEMYVYEGSGLSNGYNTSPNRPIDFADTIGGAPYWNTFTIGANPGGYPSNSRTSLLIAAADDYASGTPIRMQRAIEFVDADARMTGGTAPTLGDCLTTIFPAWRTRCTKYGKAHVNYEGGAGLAYPNAADCATLGVDTSYIPKISNLINGYKSSQLFNQACFDYWTALNTGFPAGSVPGTYYWGGAANNSDEWALIPGSPDATPWKSYNALADFNAGKVRIKAQAA